MPHRRLPGIRRVRVVAALAVVAVTAALAACSDDDDGGAAASTTTTAPATSTIAPASTTTGPTSVTGPGRSTTTATGDTGGAGRTVPTLREVAITKSSSLDYDVTGTYPQLDGLRDPVAGSVNEALATKARGVITAFEHDLTELGEAPSPGDVRSFLEVAPTATLLDARRASFRFEILTYVAGAAHPAPQIVTVTFDLGTGRSLALADLFDPSKPWLPTIADRATALLTKQFAGLGADPPFPEGVAADVANYGAWWITVDGLGIGFPSGQAGPFALGNQAVTIPWADLRDLVSPSGIAADLVQ